MALFRALPWFNRTTGTSAAGAITINSPAGEITTEALTTAGLAYYTLTITNNFVTTTSKILFTITNGTNTTDTAAVGRVTPSAGSVVLTVRNNAAATALNGTLVISFVVLG